MSEVSAMHRTADQTGAPELSIVEGVPLCPEAVAANMAAAPLGASGVSVIVRTADRTRRTEFSIDRNRTGEDIIQMAVADWSLSTETDYSLVNTATGQVILPFETLSEAIVSDGQTLQIEPVPVAGCG